MIATTDQPKPRAARARLKPGISHDMEELKKNKKLSVDELMELARLMVEAEDVDEASRHSDAFMQGFYGTK